MIGGFFGSGFTHCRLYRAPFGSQRRETVGQEDEVVRKGTVFFNLPPGMWLEREREREGEIRHHSFSVVSYVLGVLAGIHGSHSFLLDANFTPFTQRPLFLTL